MSSFQRLAGALAQLVEATGPYAPVVLFAATFVEHVFPPFPGDLLVVLGAWYVVQGAASWPASFAAVTAGAVAGAWVDYRIGRALGRRLDAGVARRSTLSAERLARFEASYRRWGGWLLLFNRFFPGVRAFIFLGAGATGIPIRRVLLLGGLSAALWNALLLGAGSALARNVDELVAFVDTYTRAAWGVLAGVALLAVVISLWRRRTARRPGAAPETPDK